MCSIRADRDELATGLRWIWFVVDRTDFDALVDGKASTAADGYHKLDVCGDAWTFYDMEILRDAAGTMSVPYYRAEIPRIFGKLLARVARRVWTMQREFGTEESRGEKVTLEFSAEYRARIVKLYGQGKGQVEWRTQPETRERIDALALEDKGFAERIAQLERIARNTTRGFHERASLYIGKDHGGSFFWNAMNPRGRSVLVGGLINHGAKTGASDWSLHT
jgi:transposase-like protein